MSNFDYYKELSIMRSAILSSYRNCFFKDITESDKSTFDIVTNNDLNIEKHLISVIHREFPKDSILSEELNYNTRIEGRTWTIDPIDGTYNMSRNIPLYGIQCALYDSNEIVLSIIYLPNHNEMYHAIKSKGAYLNENKLKVCRRDLEHSIVSFGDFPHKRPDDIIQEQTIINQLSKKIAKIRMFGSACVDFAYLSAGRTDGTVLFTKNRWDIDPGILLAQESGAIIKSLSGDYERNSPVVIATATNVLYNSILQST